MKIALLVEGRTEKALLPKLREFLLTRLPDRMPRLDLVPSHGRLPKAAQLRRIVENLLIGKRAADCVIALTDVYTGTQEFIDAADAKAKMRNWVGENEKFFPHAAQYEFEAWLLPYWETIQRLARHNKGAPPGQPESVNHMNPPSSHLREIFRLGGRGYVKVRDAQRILRESSLLVAVNACPELKSFLNTILRVSGGDILS